MNFIPDIRNLGGRKTISDMMSNHYNKMDCIRPILQTRESLNPDYKSLKLPEFKESIKRSQKPYQKRLNKTTMSDHYNNIKHMQRRIKDIGSLVERKKNRFDPISNPVLFFRESSSNSPTLQTNYIRKLLKPPKTSTAYSQSFPVKRFSTPVASLKNSDPFTSLKTSIFHEIVNKRLYKDEDLDELFKKIRKDNNHINSKIIDSAIAQVKKDLDS